ncbi:hypothetical protein C0J52_26589 [Blattella germanica]|nr:hypothetical protein C0J52_26589 [Blattella germanica]
MRKETSPILWITYLRAKDDVTGLNKQMAIIPNLPHHSNHRCQKYVLERNPGYYSLYIPTVNQILSGEIRDNPKDIPPNHIHLLKYEPVTSCEVERSFSLYKNIERAYIRRLGTDLRSPLDTTPHSGTRYLFDSRGQKFGFKGNDYSHFLYVSVSIQVRRCALEVVFPNPMKRRRVACDERRLRCCGRVSTPELETIRSTESQVMAMPLCQAMLTKLLKRIGLFYGRLVSVEIVQRVRGCKTSINCYNDRLRMLEFAEWRFPPMLSTLSISWSSILCGRVLTLLRSFKVKVKMSEAKLNDDPGNATSSTSTSRMCKRCKNKAVNGLKCQKQAVGTPSTLFNFSTLYLHVQWRAVIIMPWRLSGKGGYNQMVKENNRKEFAWKEKSLGNKSCFRAKQASKERAKGAKSLLRRLNYVIFKMLRSLNTPQWAPYALEVPKMQIKHSKTH